MSSEDASKTQNEQVAIGEAPPSVEGPPTEQIATGQKNNEAAEPEASQIAPIEDLKKLFSRVKDSLLKSSTSVEALQEAQSLVSILSAQVIAQASPLSEEQSKFFYDQFFKEVCSRAANCEIKHAPSQEAVAELMRSLVDLLAAELKMKTDTCLTLAGHMKPVLACASKFHKQAFQKVIADAEDGGNAEARHEHDKVTGKVKVSDFNEQEREWRLALETGKEIDVLKRDVKRKIQMWSKGKIVAVTGSDMNDLTKKRLVIEWFQDVSVGEGKYMADSSFIAPCGTMSISQNWRDELKKEDKVDAMDKDGEWHTADVEWVDSRTSDTKMYMIRVRFESGKDEYIGVHTARIQKPYSQTTLKDMEGYSAAMDPEVVKALEEQNAGCTIIDSWQRTQKQDEKDLLMIEQEGQIIVAVERDSCLSQLLVELVVRFSEAQGFQSVLEVLGKQETSLKGVHDLLTIVTGCSELYHKTFVDVFFDRLCEVVETKLQSADDKQLRLTTFQTIEETVDMIWIKLMNRKVPDTERQIGKYQLLTKLGILFLKQKFLQKRVDGASAIDMVCKRALTQRGAMIKDTVKKESMEVLPTLLKTLQEADIIDLYFNRANIHEEQVKRAGGILALFLNQEALSEEQLDFIWRNCSEDAIYRNLISCLSDLAAQVKPGRLTSIINRVCQTPRNKIKSDEIELVQTLCFDNKYDSEEEPTVRINQARVLQFYWDYLTDDNAHEYLNKVIANKTIFCFMDILKANSDELVEHYFEKIDEAMRQGKAASFLSLKIAHRYIKEHKVVHKTTLYVLADKLQEKHQLLQLIITELCSYSALANKQVAEEVKAAEAAEKTFDDSKLHEKIYCSVFPHQEQVTERIEFLTLFAQECSQTLSKDQLAQLWSVLVDNNQIKFDKKQLFLMLKNFVNVAISGEADNKVIAMEDLCAFYRESIAQGLSDFSNLDLEGAICLISFFILINSQAGRLRVLLDDKTMAAASAASASKSILKSSTGSGDKVTSISSNQGAVKQNLSFATQTSQIDTTSKATANSGVQIPFVETGSNAITGGVGTQTVSAKAAAGATSVSSLVSKDGFVNLVMCVAPDEVEGTASLWRIAQQADLKVYEAAVALLIQIHTNLEEPLKPRMAEFENLFISSCIGSIQDNLQVIAKRTPEQRAACAKATSEVDKNLLKPQEKTIQRAMRCLKRLIQNSETEGTFGLTCHKSFAEGQIIPNIEIENAFNYEANTGFQKTFKLKLKSNMNVWQVKKMVCSELAYKAAEKIQEQPYHPCAIKLVIKRYLDREVKDSENGMLVQELLLKAGDKIVVSPRGNDNLLKMTLLEPGTKKLTARAKEAARKLWEKFSIADTDSQDLLYMGTDQVKSLTESVSDKATLRPNSILAYNTNEDVNKLLYPDFLSYYEQMASEAPEMVRANLMYIGLRADMKDLPQPGDSDDILNLRESKEQMPRFKIGNEACTFSTLLACLDIDFDTKKEANEILLQASTNQRIMKEVLEVGPHMFDWENATEGDKSNEVVYTLALIEQFLHNDYEDEPAGAVATVANRELISTWVPRFLKSGGLSKLMVMLEKILTELKEAKKAKSESSVIIKKVLVLGNMIRIVHIFVTTTVCCMRKDPKAETFSIKQSATALSKRLTQGVITALTVNKYLRRADKAEQDLEDMLEKSCIIKSALSSFFGAAVGINANKNKPQTSTASKPSIDKPKDSKPITSDVNADDITQDMLFGGDVTYGCEPPPGTQSKPQEDKKDEELAGDQLQQPGLERQASMDDKQTEKDRIIFIKVTDRSRQIAEQISAAMQESEFDNQIDFEKLADLCLDGLSTFLFGMNKDLPNEKVFISEALEVWGACAIHADKPLNWERKAEQQEEDCKVHNIGELIIESLCSNTADTRRHFFKQLSLVCEQLSKGTSVQPYQFVIDQIITHLKTVADDELLKLNEELYEVLGDFCLQQYYIEREDTHEGRPAQEVQHTYRDIVITLIGMIKRHNSFNEEQQENLRLAQALESLLLTTADVFSFLNKKETYDQVLGLLREEQLIEYIFYEVLFFVPEKTQCPSRNKAKRPQTRKAAFQLLFKILKFLRPSDMRGFFSDMLEPMVQAVPRPQSWDHQPSDRVRRKDEQLGIRNLGNVCYMISMLQQFYWVPAFRYGLLKVADESPANMQEYKERMIDDNMLRQLQMLFGMLEQSERAMVDPTEFCFSFKQFNGEPTNTREQRDAQEFLNEFFDTLEKKLQDTSQKFLLADIFQGSIVQQKVCGGCKHVTLQEEPFYTQTLYVENNQDVYESLQKQLEGDIIQDYKCEACSQSVNLQKKQILGKLPNVLILHLQRIKFDYNTLEQKKIASRFEFPTILELSKFACKSNVTLTEEEKNDPKNKQILEMLNYEDDEFVYRLTGICIHRGRANSGHYWSLIHTNRGGKEPDPVEKEALWLDLSKEWKEFNDERVSYFVSRNIPEQGFGGYMTDLEMKTYAAGDSEDWSKSAYLLVYEKKLKSELRQVVKQPEGTEDTIEQVKFNEMPPEIPTWIQESIKKDNRAHVADSQVFHPLFFNFSSQLLKHCTAELLDQEEDYGPEERHSFEALQKLMLDSGHKLSFDLLSHFKEDDSIRSICSSVRSIFSWSDHISEFGKSDKPSLLFNFIKSVLHEDKCEYFFKLLWDSTATKDVRDHIGRTIVRVILKAIKIVHVCREDPERKDLPIVQELHTMVTEVVRTLFSVLKNRQFQQKWSRSLEYFQVLQDIGQEDHHQAEFMISDLPAESEDDIVTQLCDFMLQQKSPKAAEEPDPRIEMGGSYNKAKFGPLVALASHLVRCQWTQQSTAEQKTFIKKFEKEKNEGKTGNMVEKRIDISDRAVEYFTNKDFFCLVMSCDYDVVDYAKALAHLCHSNVELSRLICQYCIECRYEGTEPNFLIVLRQLFKLDDFDPVTGESLQAKRLEWVFGVPQPAYTLTEGGQSVKVGLEAFDFNIERPAYDYVTALNYQDQDENVSVLSFMLKSYCVEDAAKSQAVSALKAQAKKPEATQQTATAVQASEIGTSTVAEQLRAQGMPEETIKEMTAMMGNQTVDDVLTTQKPRSNSDSATYAMAQGQSANVIKVDKNINLDQLEQFMRIVTSSERTMRFFANLPGFNYQQAQFTDWVGDLMAAVGLHILNTKGDAAMSNDTNQTYQELNRLLMQKYLPFLVKFSKEQRQGSSGASDAQMIDTSDAASLEDKPPIPYMIVKKTQVADAGVSVESNGLILTASRVGCKYVTSKPTGMSNDGVSINFLKKHATDQAQNADEDADEDASSTKADAGFEQAGNGATATTGTGAAKKYSEPSQITDLVIDLDDPAVQHALTMMISDEMYSWIFEMPEDEKIQALENFVKEPVYDHVQQYYKDQKQSSGAADTAPEAKPQEAEAAASESPASGDAAMVEEAAEGDDPLAAWEGEPLCESDDLLYVLNLTNANEDAMKFKVHFKGSEGILANLIWPREGLIGCVDGLETLKVIAVLPKKTAEQSSDGLSEIQKLVIELEGEIDESKVKKVVAGQGAAAGGDGGLGGNQCTNENKHAVSIGASNAAEKQCQGCTMFNSIDATACFMCFTKFQD